MAEQARDERKQRAMDALRSLARLRERIECRAGAYQRDLIAEARVERDDQMGRIWSGGEQRRQED
jgi:vacuolar-type H+-ATPase subunit H